MPKNVFSSDTNDADGNVLDASEFNATTIFGNGADGSYTSGNNLTPGKVYNFTDFTLQAGDTLSSTQSNSGKPIIVKVQGDVTIDGTIDLSGQGFAAGEGYNPLSQASYQPDSDSWNNVTEVPTNASFAMANEASAGGSWVENISDDIVLPGIGALGYNKYEFMDASTGRIKVFSGTGGGEGKTFLRVDSDDAAAGGGGASYDANGNNGSSAFDDFPEDSASGGAGGGSLILIVGGNLDFTGEIDISGENGSVDGSNNVGGGGGAGGMFYTLYSGSLSDSGTKTVAGGSGGNPSTNANGGDGANGTIKFESVS